MQEDLFSSFYKIFNNTSVYIEVPDFRTVILNPAAL